MPTSRRDVITPCVIVRDNIAKWNAVMTRKYRMLSWKMVRIRRVMRDWPRIALSLKMKTTRETKATMSVMMLGSWIPGGGEE